MTSAIDIKRYKTRACNGVIWREQPGHFGSSFILLISFRDLRVKMITRF
jgi:hypothetical protein